MPAYQADLAKFAALDAQVVGISMDSIFSHISWQEKETGKLEYPLVSDFYPHGAVAKKYEVFREGVFADSHRGSQAQYDHARGGYWATR